MNRTLVEAGNLALLAMGLSYLGTLLLLLLIWPRDRFDWSSLAKVAGITAVIAQAVTAIYLGIGRDSSLRVIVFMVATVCCWWFTGESYHNWRKQGGRLHNAPVVRFLIRCWRGACDRKGVVGIILLVILAVVVALFVL